VGLKVSLDTNIFIGLINKETNFADSKRILDSIDSGPLSCVLSTVVIAEMCAGYHAEGRAREKDDFLAHVESSQRYEIVELTTGLADQAGRIKADTGLKLPDAIVVASALRGGAECLISNDESLRKAERLIRVAGSKRFADEMDKHRT
jgi:predicted nucleic acid-binding protein